MNIQLYQLVILATYIGLGVAFWKVKNEWLRACLVAIALTLFLVNPVRHKQVGMGGVEAKKETMVNPEFTNEFKFKQKSFQERQADEMSSLKSQSEGIKNEIY